VRPVWEGVKAVGGQKGVWCEPLGLTLFEEDCVLDQGHWQSLIRDLPEPSVEAWSNRNYSSTSWERVNR
jgi:hypothetical protein